MFDLIYIAAFLLVAFGVAAYGHGRRTPGQLVDEHKGLQSERARLEILLQKAEQEHWAPHAIANVRRDLETTEQRLRKFID